MGGSFYAWQLRERNNSFVILNGVKDLRPQLRLVILNSVKDLGLDNKEHNRFFATAQNDRGTLRMTRRPFGMTVTE